MKFRWFEWVLLALVCAASVEGTVTATPPAPPQSTASKTAPPADHQKPSKQPLTNSDIVSMVSAGLADTTVILDIQTSPTDFDTSPQALVFLQRSGVSQSVINAMLLASTGKPVPTPPAAPSSASTPSAAPDSSKSWAANAGVAPKAPKVDLHKIRKVYLEMDWADAENARARATETLKKRTCLKVVDNLNDADAKLVWTNQGLMGVDVKLFTKDDVQIWDHRSFVNPLKALRQDLGCD